MAHLMVGSLKAEPHSSKGSQLNWQTKKENANLNPKGGGLYVKGASISEKKSVY